MSEQEPKILFVVEESGELSDELDYMVNNRLMAERGMGYTACSPSLVEVDLKGIQTQVIRMGIDSTFRSDNGQVMGYGIVGYLYFIVEPFEVIYITPKDQLEEIVKYIIESGRDAFERSKGKY